jgi:hypothetical protein
MTDTGSLAFLRERIKTLEAQIARASAAEALASRRHAELCDRLDLLVPAIECAVMGNRQAILAFTRIAEANDLVIPDDGWDRCDA